MLWGYKCLDDKCQHEWEDEGYGYPRACPECNNEEFEELYEVECRDCNHSFIGFENEQCPECGSEETYEI